MSDRVRGNLAEKPLDRTVQTTSQQDRFGAFVHEFNLATA